MMPDPFDTAAGQRGNFAGVDSRRDAADQADQAPLTLESAGAMSFDAIAVDIPNGFLSSFAAAPGWAAMGLPLLKMDPAQLADALRTLAADDEKAEAVFDLLEGIGWASKWFADGARVMEALEARLLIGSAKWAMAPEGAV